jgi:adenylate cyclase class 2
VIEFEVKAPVPPGLAEALRARLGAPQAVEAHVDAYWRHPVRDFRATDEALRLSRRGGRVELTYKGPRLDARTKARREVVLSVDSEEKAAALLESLGFARAAEVRKTRALFRHAGFEVALDEVPGLGLFVELERVLPEGAARDEAEREAFALLAAWGLPGTERASYLELLERRRGAEGQR